MRASFSWIIRQMFWNITGPLHTTDHSLAVAEINELFLYPQMQLHQSICSLKDKSAFPQKWKAFLTYILGKEVMQVYHAYGFSCDEDLYPALHRNLGNFKAFASLPSQNPVCKKVHSTFSMPTLFSVISMCIAKELCDTVLSYIMYQFTRKSFLGATPGRAWHLGIQHRWLVYSMCNDIFSLSAVTIGHFHFCSSTNTNLDML